MQTSFSLAQLGKPGMEESEQILRTCVHCGLCSAACPTYTLLGDELDSPRGRIYLIKNMLEKGNPASARDTLHLDRCLTCLACTTACPSGVDYHHLLENARNWIGQTYRRPFFDRLLRWMLAYVLPRPMLFQVAMRLSPLARPITRLLPAPLRAMMELAPAAFASRPTVPATTAGKRHILVPHGCVQSVLAPQIDAATIRLFTRMGYEVIRQGGCCGAIVHHLGHDAAKFARANIDGWLLQVEGKGVDAIVLNASGCGAFVKDYAHLLRDDPAYAEKAETIASLAKDPCEILESFDLVPVPLRPSLKVAYHSACSLQHAQRITDTPKRLLQKVGFKIVDVPEGHMCCGSAGTYNILQPDIAIQLRDRKVMNVRKTAPDVVATGNIGCMVQISKGAPELPVVHTLELLDWATGGPPPAV